MSQNIKNEEIRAMIEESVDESVKQAFKKYGRTFRFPRPRIRSVVSIVVVAAILITGIGWVQNKKAINQRVDPVENHDLTIDNDGIFGFTAADFEKPILGKSTRQKKLVVEEQEVYVNTTITDTGLFDFGVFNKAQALTIHGTGQYYIDLSEISAQDISLNEDTFELTIAIPHAALQTPVTFDPSQTEVGDTDKGWLAFGEIKMTQEQQKEFEKKSCKELEEKLSEAECLEEADRFAKMSAYELYQPIVSAVSPAYKVVIKFRE